MLRCAVLCCATVAFAFVATALVGAPLAAQDSTTAPTAGTRSTAPTALVSLGEAARIAARNNANAQTARVRVSEAQARVTERRADLLPTLRATGSQETRTLNTASFGLSFPTAPGQPPLFDPNGEVIPPFSIVDYRGRMVLPLFDFSAIARLRGARASVTESRAEATVTSEQAASQAATAYIRALRAADDFRARSEDSVLAADLANVAQAQLQAGTGVALDVTRARSQLVATRAQLIASRAARD
ncbi:MAG: TolC family protein, partial [Gemmatimonadaceae bacterium]